MNTETALDMTLELNGDAEQIIAADKYLSFMVGNKSYGVAISRIKEIIEYFSVTRVPMTPSFIRGVINLRGRVVPVVDLASRLESVTSEVGKRSCIVIVEVEAGEEQVEIGYMVDGVTEVVSLSNEMIEPAPSFGLNLRPEFVAGMGKMDQDVVVLLDVDTVLSIAELAEACGHHSENMTIGTQEIFTEA